MAKTKVKEPSLLSEDRGPGKPYLLTDGKIVLDAEMMVDEVHGDRDTKIKDASEGKMRWRPAVQGQVLAEAQDAVEALENALLGVAEALHNSGILDLSGARALEIKGSLRHAAKILGDRVECSHCEGQGRVGIPCGRCGVGHAGRSCKSCGNTGLSDEAQCEPCHGTGKAPWLAGL